MTGGAKYLPYDAIKKVHRKPFTVRLWDTGRVDGRGCTNLAFEVMKGRKRIYHGEDFHGSPLYADDSNETVASLLSFASHDLGKEDSSLGDELFLLAESLRKR